MNVNSSQVLGYVEKNSILSQLLVSGPDSLRSRLQFVHCAADETIYHEGDRLNYVYFPLDSVVSSMAMLNDGGSVEIAMVGSDSFLGLQNIFGSRISQYSNSLCIGGRLARLDFDQFMIAFSENGQVAKLILDNYTALVEQISQRSVCHAKHGVFERFSCWLLMIDERVQGGVLPLTHELVSTRLGTRRAGITVSARTLLEEDAIEYKRGQLRIKDRERVERHACECYLKLRLRTENRTQTVLRSQKQEPHLSIETARIHMRRINL